nr:RecName: Full=29 kDa cell wall protein; AltName: Full=27 kDa cell wall protein [Nicotiana tabacum]
GYPRKTVDVFTFTN